MEETARREARRDTEGATQSGSENDGATQSNENTLDSNIYLKYYILRIIFRYLNARDLARVTMVCRLWLEAANDEKQSLSRRGPCHCIINRDKMDDLVRYIKNIRIIPSIGFFFLPDDISRNVEDLIYNLLPEHCEVIILHCPKSISVVDEEKRLKIVESVKLFRAEDAGKRKENSEFYKQICLLRTTRKPLPNIVCVFLPQILNVRIKSYTMDISSVIDSVNSRKIINKITNFVTSTSNHKISKTYVMLFCKHYCRKAKYFADIFNQNSQEDKIAPICSNLVEDICASYIASDNVRRKNHPDITAVVLTGSIQMWSIYFDLSPFCDIKKRIEAQLNLFKDKVTLKRHSIGFMFTTHRIELNEDAIAEQETFKRLFPKVPLVVCYDYDHVGEEIEVDKDEKDKYEEDSIGILQFCTMFMILTYG